MGCRAVKSRAYGMSRNWAVAQMGCHAAEMSRNWNVAQMHVAQMGCRARKKSRKWHFPAVCSVYCRIILLSQISSISSQNRVQSRRNTFFWRIVVETIVMRFRLHRWWPCVRNISCRILHIWPISLVQGQNRVQSDRYTSLHGCLG